MITIWENGLINGHRTSQFFKCFGKNDVYECLKYRQNLELFSYIIENVTVAVIIMRKRRN